MTGRGHPMKTVQSWLNEVNEIDLVDTYFAYFPINYEMAVDRTLTLGEVKDRARKYFLKFVRDMKRIKLKSSDTKWIFFASNRYQEGHSEIDVNLCRLDDLCSSKQAECCSWILNDFSETMGYYIAETSLTQKNIPIVLARILYENTFFGYDQKAIEEERRKLEESCKEIERGEYYTWEEVDKEMRETFGFELSDPPEPEVTEKEDAIHAAEHAYNAFCLNREIEKLREMDFH